MFICYRVSVNKVLCDSRSSCRVPPTETQRWKRTNLSVWKEWFVPTIRATRRSASRKDVPRRWQVCGRTDRKNRNNASRSNWTWIWKTQRLESMRMLRPHWMVLSVALTRYTPPLTSSLICPRASFLLHCVIPYSRWRPVATMLLKLRNLHAYRKLGPKLHWITDAMQIWFS